MGENSERPFDRRTILKTIGAGVAVPTLGGVASANNVNSNGNGNGNGGGDISADCQFLRGKWEAEGGALSFEDGVGDSLNIAGSDDDVVTFSNIVYKDGTDEIIAFDWDSSPYAMATVAVKTGQETFELTYDPAVTSGTVDLRELDTEGSIQAVSHVSFGAALYLQADVIMGADAEDPPYLSDESDDSLIGAAIGNSCDRGAGTLQYPDADPDIVGAFDEPFGGLLERGEDDDPVGGFNIDMNDLELGAGDVQYSFALSSSATQSAFDTSKTGFETKDIDGDGTDEDAIIISLTVYERPGPAFQDAEIEDRTDFQIKDQELLDIDTVEFAAASGFDSESTDGDDEPLTTSF